jgi:hypothetical protein
MLEAQVNKMVMDSVASPSFSPINTPPANIADTGKVRIGNLSPSFPQVNSTPAYVADAGKVRVGNLSPSFPPVRAAS